MEKISPIATGILSLVVAILLFRLIRRRKSEDGKAQERLDEYLKGPLSTLEIGTFYERYIGYLFEKDGHYVKYHGAVKGFEDMGRDLIVEKEHEVLIIQTKCWAKFKKIPEKHIYQLYGSMIHYKRTVQLTGKVVRAVFYTSAQYSDAAVEAAKVLGVELVQKDLDMKYPMVKCNVNQRGQRIYHLPFDPYYDKISIDLSQGKMYVFTVNEAVARGFRRARKKIEDEAS